MTCALVPDFIYDRFIDLWHRYLLVGGMPAAVAHFVETGDMDVVRRIQGNIRQRCRPELVLPLRFNAPPQNGHLSLLMPSSMKYQT